MPDPRGLRRRAFADELLRVVRLRERIFRPAQVAQRLRRPGERACEALVVPRAPKLIRGVTVMRERALVVAAHAMEQTAKKQHPRKSPLDPRREAIEPALKSPDLAALYDELAVIADQLRRALVLAGLLQVMERAMHSASTERALGMTAMQLDDLGRRQQLARARAQELREERLKTMAAPGRAVPNDDPGLLQRGHELARRAARRHRLVLLKALEQRPSQERVLVGTRAAAEDLAVEVRIQLGAASAELTELAPDALAHERRGEPQTRGPAARAPIDRVDGVLGKVQAEFTAQELDRLGTRERELGRGDVQDRARETPPRKTPELGRPAGRKDQVRVVGKELDELTAEDRERRAALHARVVIHEEDKLTDRRKLVGERLRELRQLSLEPAPMLERREELLAELRVVAPERTDEVGEKHEWILVAALKGEPGHAPAGSAEKVRVLREEGRLAVAGGGMHERQSMPVGTPQSIEQPLPLQERKR